MPDLSILVQLAEYYDVEMRELLDGERSQTMNKEMKETLDKVAVYEEWVKQKALKAGNLAFASMFVISVLAIIIQMLLTVDVRLVLGETATVLVGGILYASIMVYNGIWDKCLLQSATIWRDFLTSVICAGSSTQAIKLPSLLVLPDRRPSERLILAHPAPRFPFHRTC